MPLAAKDKKKVRPEDRQVDMDSPTFVPMVRVGKVLDTNGSGDSIQSVELNNVYVFGPMEFKNERQRKESVAYSQRGERRRHRDL